MSEEEFVEAIFQRDLKIKKLNEKIKELEKDYVSKDKIKAKIKELQDNIPDLKTSTTVVNNIEQIKMLQKLLEGE